MAQKTVSTVNHLIDDATSKGAKVIAGGKAESGIMPATVVDGVTAAMDLYRDESFGPIVAIIRARDAEHAIELANDSQYGLNVGPAFPQTDAVPPSTLRNAATESQSALSP